MFWDSVAGVYDLFVNVVNRRTHLTLRKIVANLIQPGDSVLECACGTGLLTGVIAQKCGHLTATDFAPKMLAKARKNCAAFGNITFEPADITSLGYPDIPWLSSRQLRRGGGRERDPPAGRTDESTQ